MKVRVLLFGTLRKYVSGYDSKNGFEIDIPDGSKVRDLLAHLGIPKSEIPVITIDYRMAVLDDELADKTQVNLLQLAHGG